VAALDGRKRCPLSRPGTSSGCFRHSPRAFRNRRLEGCYFKFNTRHSSDRQFIHFAIQQSRSSYIDLPPGFPWPSQSSHVQVSRSSYSKSLPFPLPILLFSIIPLSGSPLSTTRYPLLASRTAPANEKPNDTINAILHKSASMPNITKKKPIKNSPLKNPQHNNPLRYRTNPPNAHLLRDLHRARNRACSPQKRHRTFHAGHYAFGVPFRSRTVGGEGDEVD
jgi:hypothetical protein